jgi:CHASE3 domain sensor protein
VAEDELRAGQRRAARRTTIVLVLVVLAIFVGFIAMSVIRSRG